MGGTPEGIPGDSRKKIPARTHRAAALFALLPSGVSALVIFGGILKGNSRAPDWYAPVAVVGIWGGSYLMILFGLVRIRAGQDWNKRGGGPDPFTRA